MNLKWKRQQISSPLTYAHCACHTEASEPGIEGWRSRNIEFSRNKEILVKRQETQLHSFAPTCWVWIPPMACACADCSQFRQLLHPTLLLQRHRGLLCNGLLLVRARNKSEGTSLRSGYCGFHPAGAWLGEWNEFSLRIQRILENDCPSFRACFTSHMDFSQLEAVLFYLFTCCPQVLLFHSSAGRMSSPGMQNENKGFILGKALGRNEAFL